MSQKIDTKVQKRRLKKKEKRNLIPHVEGIEAHSAGSNRRPLAVKI
jgi:hypothetical protein